MYFGANTDHGSKEEEQGEEGEVMAKQPKKKRPPKRTVEQNLSNINSPDCERKCEVCCHLYRRRTISNGITVVLLEGIQAGDLN